MELRILPSNIANLIAAGEVVQRPASVVKELMENAVDALATKIIVVIKDSGRTLVRVLDDGCGMSPDDAVLCFERHATSKIATAEDLGGITTFGFRGEALASIAAVSQVTLRTRREEDGTGCQVEFADSQHLSTIETACPKGTDIAVRDLFYNVPARRKFLKSDNVEFKHIVEEFCRVALTRPDIAFTLTHNDRDIHVLRPAKSLKFRIQDLMGNAAADKVVEVSAETTVVSVEGFVCRPDLARKTVADQFFFINGRYFRSAYLHKAVMKAYEGLIAPGMVPSYFLYMRIDPHEVDVNIHPTKTEVKFEDDGVIFQIVYACVKEALGRNSFGANIEFDVAEAPQMPVMGRGFDDYRPSGYNPVEAPQSDYNPFDTASGFEQGGGSAGQGGPSAYNAGGDWPKGLVQPRQDYGKLFESQTVPLSSIIIFQGRYIVSPVKEGLMLVHIRRARERVMYERFLRALSGGSHVSQSALLPVQVNVGVQSRLLLDDNREMLEKLGFDITSFGSDTVVVNGVPEGFSSDEQAVEELVGQVLEILSEDSGSLPGVMESAMAGKFAAAAAMGGRKLSSPLEAQKLIDTLLSCDSAEFTPRGRRIITVLKMDDLDKMF
ncbi:MAG: DNA mismatch repair endonuclease MutL [Bacteroidales bacterium]|nr:DNA mismatch repair endonuclease MutL [Bacteroidales bacterium]